MGEPVLVEIPPKTITHAKLTTRECREIAREEIVFVHFCQDTEVDTIQRNGHPIPGEWRVTDAVKVVSPGQTVFWKAVGTYNDLELLLPDVFEPQYIKVGHSVASATVKDTAHGSHQYEIYVDGVLARGNSLPKVIIDP
jgi:hypothetical protein